MTGSAPPARRVVSWVGLLALGAIAAAVYVLRAGESAGGLVQPLVAVVTLALTIALWLWRRGRPVDTGRLTLAHAADQLAEQVRQQWMQAAVERRLIYPTPIPVQWQWSPRQVTGSITEAVAGPFAPLPGIPAVTVVDLQYGALKDLLGVYGGLGSGRLIVLGEPGAGKSVAGIRLLLDALDHRATVTPRNQVPVPVLVTPQGWDPTTELFAEWLADRLARDYVLLRAPEYGRDAAVRLIKGGCVAVILDGLDEMPEALRSVALSALDEQATFRVVVLTRTEELVATVGVAHLRGAAALELQPTGPSQVADYLANCQIKPPPAPWQRLIDHLREHSDGVLAQALNTPLMLTLIRDTYGPREKVDELIDGSRFDSREAIEDRLLDRVLTAAYTPHPGRPAPLYKANQAQQWLVHLALRMHHKDSRDLAWWQIPSWVSPLPRALFLNIITFGFGIAAAVGLWKGLQNGIAVGLVGALVSGGGLAFASEHNARLPQQLGRLQWRRINTRVNLGLGLVAALGAGLDSGLSDGIAAGLGVELGVGLGVVLVLGFTDGLGRPSTEATSPLDPRTSWHRDLQFGLGLGLVLGFVVGLGAGLIAGLEAGLIAGLEEGLIVGLIYWPVLSATGATTFATVQLWRRGEAPLRLLLFLDDARARQILRTVGPVYQFRHARLQDRLAESCTDMPSVHTARKSWAANPTQP